jgi:drug/metabolite transporter (DMT)-like permease
LLAHQHGRNSKWRAFAALAAAGSLWGTGFLFGKWALTELSVGHFVLYRFLFASLGFAPATFRGLRRAATRIARRDVPIFFIAALLGVPVQFIVQFAGLDRTTVSHASLMVGNLPVLLAAGAALFAHERVTAGRWLALFASTIGAALIALGASKGEGGAQATVIGDLLVVASLIAAVAWVLLSQRLMKAGRDYSPMVTSAYVMTAGTVMLAAWVVATEGLPSVHLSFRTWASVAASGLLATTVTTYLWNWGLARVPASQAGVFVNLEPVVGAILGVILLHDILGPYALVGGLLVVAAAIFVAIGDTDVGQPVRSSDRVAGPTVIRGRQGSPFDAQ